MKAIICILFLFPLVAYSQQYPQGYFRNPLDIPILLAGNFGECRPGHFHSGLDIKTQGRENMPVRAAAEGYVSRIKTDKDGFGHALYITHPNGYTTLYAHLNDFAPAMQKYLKQQQYEKKRWDLDMTLPPTKFPVKKGEQIAWSGNTGGSSAPHLHFEIRDTKTEHPLNPQLFGFDIKDTIAPVVREVVIYTNPTFNFYTSHKTIVDVTKIGGLYRPVNVFKDNPHVRSLIDDTVLVEFGEYGFGVVVDDYMNNSENTITFYTAEVYINDSLWSKVKLDDIGYDETRYINAYIDYPLRKQEQKWAQCLFRLPGNRLGIYSNLGKRDTKLNFEGDGSLFFLDGKTYRVNIVLTDNTGNETKIVFYMKTLLEFTSIHPIYLGDRTDFWPDTSNNFRRENIYFSLDDRQLYDGVNFYFSAQKNDSFYSDKYKLHYPYVPVHHYFDLKIKPNKSIPPELKSKVVMKYSDDKDEDGRAAVAIDSGWYSAKVRAFGTYWLDIDTTAPIIASMQRKSSNLSKARQIAFTVKDNMTSVKTFSGYLDGKWICFEQHGDDFFYKFDEHCPKGKHVLVFKAADENGNEATYNLNFVK